MNPPVLELSRLSKTFRSRDAMPLRAVDDASLHIDRGECVALVGESGSGKSTLARLALRLMAPDSGTVTLQGRSRRNLPSPALRAARLTMQPIFQDPAASFNPRRTVRAILTQVLLQAGATSVGDEQLGALLARVELRPARTI